MSYKLKWSRRHPLVITKLIEKVKKILLFLLGKLWWNLEDLPEPGTGNSGMIKTVEVSKRIMLFPWKLGQLSEFEGTVRVNVFSKQGKRAFLGKKTQQKLHKNLRKIKASNTSQNEIFIINAYVLRLLESLRPQKCWVNAIYPSPLSISI